jgi:hypothetical protein
MAKTGQWMIQDYDLRRVVDEYGGWKVVLDASFQPPEELLAQLDKLTCSRELFWACRANVHALYLEQVCSRLWSSWRFGFWGGRPNYKHPEKTPFNSNIRWTDASMFWDSPDIVEIISRYQITRDEVDDFMMQHPERFPRTLPQDVIPPDSPSLGQAGVPRRTPPKGGAGEIALQPPTGEEEKADE